MVTPGYLLLSSNELQKRIEAGYSTLKSCTLCPRECNVDRLSGKTGFCRMGAELKISSYFPHRGEEPPISGTNGSGTVFFSGCVMKCFFCQNYQISHMNNGRFLSHEELAIALIELQEKGCHNINLVTPTQWVPQILKSFKLAIEKGLHIPIIYNTNGYESVETLKLLDGIIDVYLPDMKYAANEVAKKLSNVSNYVEVNRECVKEMFRQVGHLKLDENGLAKRGLIIRHLILPENLAGTEDCLKFLHDNFGKEIAVSLMAQYTPLYKAKEIPEINRRITPDEYRAAVKILEELGLENGWYQMLDEMDDEYVFNFK